jgi:hypothetical protein
LRFTRLEIFGGTTEARGTHSELKASMRGSAGNCKLSSLHFILPLAFLTLSGTAHTPLSPPTPKVIKTRGSLTDRRNITPNTAFVRLNYSRKTKIARTREPLL